MKLGIVSLLCGMVCAAVMTPARADEVDDLLSGKSIATDAKASEMPLAPVLDAQLSAGFETVPLGEGSPWDSAVVGEPSRAPRAVTPAEQADSRPPAPTASVTMVPEPQAILLAALALLYFLIFFRRRHHLA